LGFKGCRGYLVEFRAKHNYRRVLELARQGKTARLGVDFIKIGCTARSIVCSQFWEEMQ
jgi:hypothetical protein